MQSESLNKSKSSEENQSQTKNKSAKNEEIHIINEESKDSISLRIIICPDNRKLEILQIEDSQKNPTSVPESGSSPLDQKNDLPETQKQVEEKLETKPKDVPLEIGSRPCQIHDLTADSNPKCTQIPPANSLEKSKIDPLQFQKTEIEIAYEKMIANKINVFKVVRDNYVPVQIIKNYSDKPVSVFGSNQAEFEEDNLRKRGLGETGYNLPFFKRDARSNPILGVSSELIQAGTHSVYSKMADSGYIRPDLDGFHKDRRFEGDRWKEPAGHSGLAKDSSDRGQTKSSSFISPNMQEAKFISQMSGVFRAEIQKILDVLHWQNIEYQNAMFGAIRRHFEESK